MCTLGQDYSVSTWDLDEYLVDFNEGKNLEGSIEIDGMTSCEARTRIGIRRDLST